MRSACFILALLAQAMSCAAFMPRVGRIATVRGGALAMADITEGVSFDTVAREWRCKWSPDGDKASLAAAQVALNDILAEVKAVPGVKDVQRVVCGGCLDFKVACLPSFVLVTLDSASL